MEITARASVVALHECTVNGQPGLIGQHDGTTVSVYAFDIADGRITRIWVVRNPEKLRLWARRASTGALQQSDSSGLRSGKCSKLVAVVVDHTSESACEGLTNQDPLS